MRSCDAQGGQGPFGRIAVVGRRDGDPAAAGAQPVEQGTQVGHGSGGRDRVGRVPGRLERPFRIGRRSGRSPRAPRACGRAGAPSASRPALRRHARSPSPGRPRASRRGARRSAVPWPSTRPSTRATAQPLHMDPNSMIVPSLSKTTRSMPSSRTVTPPRRPPSWRAPRLVPRRGRSTPRAGRRSSPPSSTSGSRRCGSLNVSRAITVGVAPSSPSPTLTRIRTIEPRKLMSSTVPCSRFSPGSPSPSSIPSGRSASVTRPFAPTSVDGLARPDFLAVDRQAAGARVDDASRHEVERADERGHERAWSGSCRSRTACRSARSGPSLMTTTRSDSERASSWSWVT